MRAHSKYIRNKTMNVVSNSIQADETCVSSTTILLSPKNRRKTKETVEIFSTMDKLRKNYDVSKGKLLSHSNHSDLSSDEGDGKDVT